MKHLIFFALTFLSALPVSHADSINPKQPTLLFQNNRRGFFPPTAITQCNVFDFFVERKSTVSSELVRLNYSKEIPNLMVLMRIMKAASMGKIETYKMNPPLPSDMPTISHYEFLKEINSAGEKVTTQYMLGQKGYTIIVNHSREAKMLIDFIDDNCNQ